MFNENSFNFFFFHNLNFVKCISCNFVLSMVNSHLEYIVQIIVLNNLEEDIEN